MKRKNHSGLLQTNIDKNPSMYSLNQKLENFEEKYANFVDKCSTIIRENDKSEIFYQVTAGICNLIHKSREITIGKHNKQILIDLESNIQDYMSEKQQDLTKFFESNMYVSPSNKGKHKQEPTRCTISKNSSQSRMSLETNRDRIEIPTPLALITERSKSNLQNSRLKKHQSARNSSLDMQAPSMNTLPSHTNLRILTSMLSSSEGNTTETDKNVLFLDKLENIRKKLIQFDNTAKVMFRNNPNKSYNELEAQVEELNKQLRVSNAELYRQMHLYDMVIGKNKKLEEDIEDLNYKINHKQPLLDQNKCKYSIFGVVSETKVTEGKQHEDKELSKVTLIERFFCKVLRRFSKDLECKMVQILKKEGILNSRLVSLRNMLGAKQISRAPTMKKNRKSISISASVSKSNKEKSFVATHDPLQMSLILDGINNSGRLKRENSADIKELESVMSGRMKIENKLSEYSSYIKELSEKLNKLLNHNDIQTKEIDSLKGTHEVYKKSIDDLLSMNYSLQSNLAQQEKTSADLRKENITLKFSLPSEKDTKKTQERFLEKRKTTNIPEINYYKESLANAKKEIQGLHEKELLINNKLEEYEQKLSIADERLKELYLEKIETTRENKMFIYDLQNEKEKGRTNMQYLNQEMINLRQFLREIQVLVKENSSQLRKDSLDFQQNLRH